MSTLGLFAMGLLVTLIVGTALGLLVYGAILDGRDETQLKAERARQLEARQGVPRPVGGRRSAA